MENQTYNINYGYTTFLAFLMNIRFNNSRKIEIDILKKYPKIFLKKIKSYETNNFNIVMLETGDDLESFLKLNSEIFTFDDKYIYLNSKVSLNDLYKILNRYNYPFTNSSIYVIQYDNELKEVLKLDGISKKFDKYDLFEEKIKSYYLSYAYGLNKDNYYEEIRDLLEKRNEFYHKIASKNKELIEDCHAEASTYEKSNPLAYYYPLDSEIDYDSMFPNDFNCVDEVLNDVYMFTIFMDTSNPTRYRIYEDINGLDLKYAYRTDTNDNEEYKRIINKRLMKESLKTGKIIYTPRCRSQLLFYLKYIKCIEELEQEYDNKEELELVKYKLLYLLDNPLLNLLEDNNIDKTYDELYSQYIYEKDISDEDRFGLFNEYDDINVDPFEFDWFKVLIKALIYDVFEGELYDEELLLKKLAMIKTYYSITQDKDIIDMINNYSDNPNFWKYYSYIRKRNKLLVKEKKDGK